MQVHRAVETRQDLHAGAQAEPRAELEGRRRQDVVFVRQVLVEIELRHLGVDALGAQKIERGQIGGDAQRDPVLDEAAEGEEHPEVEAAEVRRPLVGDLDPGDARSMSRFGNVAMNPAPTLTCLRCVRAAGL